MHKHETPHAHNCACHACHGTHGQNHQSRNGSSSSGESPSSDDDVPSQPQLTTIHDHSHDSDLKALKEYTDDVMKDENARKEDERIAFGHYHEQKIRHPLKGHRADCHCTQCEELIKFCDQCGRSLSECTCNFLGKTYHESTYSLAHLDCLICAARLESALRRLPAVFFASLSFRTKMLYVISREDMSHVLPSLKKTAARIDPKIQIMPFISPEKAVTKTYDMPTLDCPNCTLKLEKIINQQEGVISAEISYASKKLRLTALNPDALLPSLREACNAIEPGTRIVDASEAQEEKPSAESKDRTLPAGLACYILGLILYYLPQAPRLWGIVLLLASYLLLGWPVFKNLIRNIRHGEWFDENVLMTIATAGALGVGEYPEASGVLFFFRIGEVLEDRASEKSRREITKAVDMRPDTVILLKDGTETTVDASSIHVGDTLMIRPGDRIPLDGIVLSGNSHVDTSPITGESDPREIHPGISLVSGCVNLEGTLTMQVTKELSESMVTRILDAVENAAATKPELDRFITRFSRIYVPVVVGIALVTAILPPLWIGGWKHWIYTAMTFLVISCPCALVISVPLSFFAGIGAASKKGILFKSGQVIEKMATIRNVLLDKTGTLTKGRFSVVRIEREPGIEETELLSLAAGLETYSTHPIAHSIVNAARARDCQAKPFTDVQEISGHGLEGNFGNDHVCVGNRKWMLARGIPVNTADTWEGTSIYVAVNNHLAGKICIADTPKDDAADAVRQLHDMGLHVVMLTGDTEKSARMIADKLHIDEVHASLLPEDKLKEMQNTRIERGPVLFTGDGINDAPVLAGADVGAAMGSGSDAAITVADTVYMTSQVSSIPESIRLAKKTVRTAQFNTLFALTVKALVMLLGFAGYANMWLAVFADTGVTLLCILFSMTLLRDSQKQ